MGIDPVAVPAEEIGDLGGVEDSRGLRGMRRDEKASLSKDVGEDLGEYAEIGRHMLRVAGHVP